MNYIMGWGYHRSIIKRGLATAENRLNYTYINLHYRLTADVRDVFNATVRCIIEAPIYGKMR